MYPNSSGNSIGTLLRLIQEDQNQNLAALPPSAEAASPIRGMVQQPLMSNEAPGSNRVISTAPEGVTPQGPISTPQVIAPSAPVAPVAPAPSAPSAPSIATNISTPPPQPQSQPIPSPIPTEILANQGFNSTKPVGNMRIGTLIVKDMRKNPLRNIS